MKHTLQKSLFLAAAGLLLPGLAFGHPGHFAFDPTVAPHAGHEIQLGSVLLTVALSLALFAAAGWLQSRRR